MCNQGLNSWLRSQGFHDDSDSDQVVYLYTFLPLIRDEIFQYVNNWNEHTIRPQRNRQNHVAGVPRKLYEEFQEKISGDSTQQQRHGFPPSKDEIAAWNSVLNNFGKFELNRSCRCEMVANFGNLLDLNQDLEAHCRTWCSHQLQLLNKTTPIEAREFM